MVNIGLIDCNTEKGQIPFAPTSLYLLQIPNNFYPVRNLELKDDLLPCLGFTIKPGLYSYSNGVESRT
jgi:hypothetical protein